MPDFPADGAEDGDVAEIEASVVGVVDSEDVVVAGEVTVECRMPTYMPTTQALISKWVRARMKMELDL